MGARFRRRRLPGKAPALTAINALQVARDHPALFPGSVCLRCRWGSPPRFYPFDEALVPPDTAHCFTVLTLSEEEMTALRQMPEDLFRSAAHALIERGVGREQEKENDP